MKTMSLEGRVTRRTRSRTSDDGSESDSGSLKLKLKIPKPLPSSGTYEIYQIKHNLYFL